jgi:DNA polymerase III alpha subunit
MNYDKFGQVYCSTDELCDIIYKNPTQDISHFFVDAPELYNSIIDRYYSDLPKLQQYSPLDITVDEFDQLSQSTWYMPAEYHSFDIIDWLIAQCNNEDQLQRVASELLLYQEKELITLLKFLKYLVDTMKQHNIVRGVGRGSSVASYVLYLIGIHSIDSLYYDLDINEFLR